MLRHSKHAGKGLFARRLRQAQGDTPYLKFNMLLKKAQLVFVI